MDRRVVLHWQVANPTQRWTSRENRRPSSSSALPSPAQLNRWRRRSRRSPPAANFRSVSPPAPPHFHDLLASLAAPSPQHDGPLIPDQLTFHIYCSPTQPPIMNFRFPRFKVDCAVKFQLARKAGSHHFYSGLWNNVFNQKFLRYLEVGAHIYSIWCRAIWPDHTSFGNC
jgi:hypothetical protein